MELGVYMTYLGNSEGLNFPSVLHMWPSAEINQWPTPVYSCCWSAHFLIEYAYFELVVLKTCTKNQNDFSFPPKLKPATLNIISSVHHISLDKCTICMIWEK
jgi:hypothetical protein